MQFRIAVYFYVPEGGCRIRVKRLLVEPDRSAV
jgi:hypothetical protein